MGRRRAKLTHGNRIYVTHHAMQRRMEAEGIETDFIFSSESDYLDRQRRASIRSMMLNELAECELISYQHSLLFRHPKRQKHADNAEYRLTPNRNFCYVVTNGRVVTVIAVTKNQSKTLTSLLNEETARISIVSENFGDDPPVSQITKKDDASAYQELRSLMPTLRDNPAKLWMVTGLNSEPTLISSEKLKRMIKALFEIFEYEVFRMVYNGLVVHLHKDENILPALKGVRNLVPPYEINIKDDSQLQKLLESGCINCPTFVITDKTSAIKTCLAISRFPESLTVPKDRQWLAYFVHSDKTNLESSVALGKKYNFAA